MKKSAHKQTCDMCGGTNKVTAWFRENKDDKKATKKIVDCLCTGSSKEIWESLCFLLAQFIRCKIDKPFNPKDPYRKDCEGCDYERAEILDHVWHYAEARMKETKDSEITNV